jgi:hypothetical protein
MALDLQSFKTRQRATSLSNITDSFAPKSSAYTDSRYWKITTPDKKDGAANSAIIRFLPSHNPEKPFVSSFSYSFTGVGGQYIENSLESIGQLDPVKEYNTKLWNSGDPEKKEDTKKRNRKLHYIGNILVVNDVSHPENNGKVFLYQFGSKIMAKITAIMTGDPAVSQPPVDIFDFDNGANFYLKMHYEGKSGFYSYDSSHFNRESSIGEEAYQSSIIQQIYDLDNCEPVKYKPYEELQTRFRLVMCPPKVEDEFGLASPPPSQVVIPTPPTTPLVKVSIPPTSSSSTDDEFSDFDSLIDNIPF